MRVHVRLKVDSSEDPPSFAGALSTVLLSRFRMVLMPCPLLLLLRIGLRRDARRQQQVCSTLLTAISLVCFLSFSLHSQLSFSVW